MVQLMTDLNARDVAFDPPFDPEAKWDELPDDERRHEEEDEA